MRDVTAHKGCDIPFFLFIENNGTHIHAIFGTERHPAKDGPCLFPTLKREG